MSEAALYTDSGAARETVKLRAAACQEIVAGVYHHGLTFLLACILNYLTIPHQMRTRFLLGTKPFGKDIDN